MNILTIMYSISIGISLILLGFIIYSIKTGQKHINEPDTSVKIPTDVKDVKHLEDVKGIPIGELRHYGDFDITTGEKSFFISQSSKEALGIYLSVTPNIVNALMKVANEMDELNSIVVDPAVDSSLISSKITRVMHMLKPLVEAADKLNSQIYNICTEIEEETEQVEIAEDLVSGFIRNSKAMIHYSIDYLHLINIIRLRIEKKGLPLSSRFNALNNDFIHVFFIGILNCTSMLDATIRVMK